MPLTLVATGGTIAATMGSDGKVTTSLSGRDLLSGLGHLAGDDVEVVELPVPGSWNMSGAHALRVVLAAEEALHNGATGVVITHGTDLMEETSYLAELVARSATVNGPIVFTGAMRHASEFGGDGMRNLSDALAVAREPSAAGRGALVCVNGELHHARWVVKTHTTALSTFESPGRAPVGVTDAAGVRFSLASPPPPPDPPEEPRLDASVPIVLSQWDSEEGLIPWLLERGAKGLVVEAIGSGNVAAGLLPGIARAIDSGIPVVVTSRCRRGEVTPIYGGPGGFSTLVERGAIPSHGLTSGKARLALQLALCIDPDPDAVREYFQALADTP